VDNKSVGRPRISKQRKFSVTISIDKESLDILDKLGSENGSRSEHMRKAIKRYGESNE